MRTETQFCKSETTRLLRLSLDRVRFNDKWAALNVLRVALEYARNVPNNRLLRAHIAYAYETVQRI